MTDSAYSIDVDVEEIGVHDDLLTMDKKRKLRWYGGPSLWPHLKILWHGEDNSARDSERSKKEKKTEEEMGSCKYHICVRNRMFQRNPTHYCQKKKKITSRNGREWGLEFPQRAAEDREMWKGIVATSSMEILL